MGFEFEIKFNEKELKFIDMKTDVLKDLGLHM